MYKKRIVWKYERDMKRKIMSIVFVLVLLVSTISVHAESGAVDPALNYNDSVLENRSIMRLSKTATAGSPTRISVTVNYTYQESTGKVAAIDLVYVSGYNESYCRNVSVYNWSLSGNNMTIIIKYQSIGSNEWIPAAVLVNLTP